MVAYCVFLLRGGGRKAPSKAGVKTEADEGEERKKVHIYTCIKGEHQGQKGKGERKRRAGKDKLCYMHTYVAGTRLRCGVLVGSPGMSLVRPRPLRLRVENLELR